MDTPFSKDMAPVINEFLSYCNNKDIANLCPIDSKKMPIHKLEKFRNEEIKNILTYGAPSWQVMAGKSDDSSDLRLSDWLKRRI